MHVDTYLAITKKLLFGEEMSYIYSVEVFYQ